MQFGFADACLDHDPGADHPEAPARLRAIRDALDERDAPVVTPEPAMADDLTAVHDPAYVERVERFCTEGGGRWDVDTVASEGTWAAIRHAAGLARWAGKRASTSDEVPFALPRPPGHHATRDDAMGFCFVNNVALAAEQALDHGADGVAVLDWDVHHGNGTQDAFDDRSEVWYGSVHGRGLFPGTGAVTETGRDDAAGTVCNLPLPPGAGDAAYGHAFDSLFAPLLRRFDPDCLLVSAGFDAHRTDPLGPMRVTAAGFDALARRLRALAADLDASCGFVLEGGYDPAALARSVEAVAAAWSGADPGGTGAETPSAAARDAVERARAVHDLD